MIRSNSTRPSSQAGSAYVIVIFVLLLLTIFGLSLVYVTQTERQIGDNVRTETKNFFAADAGIDASVAMLLTRNQYEGFTVDLLTSPNDQSVARYDVETNRITPVLSQPCALCDVSTTSMDPPPMKVNHDTEVRAIKRLGNLQLAQKRIGVQVELQPRQTTADALYDGPLDYGP
ncbi:MAG: pilus assembly PilX N-terminal domain-containing protein [Acidobacteriota bacterium]